MLVPKPTQIFHSLCLSVHLFYSYSYQDSFRISYVWGKDVTFLVKNGEQTILHMKT